jgi:hypothetical protein
LPGLRIGWLACRDRALLERLERRKHYTTICNPVPSEHLAAIALRNGDAIRARNRAIVAENVPVFEAFFADRILPPTCSPPRSVRCRRTASGSARGVAIPARLWMRSRASSMSRTAVAVRVVGERTLQEVTR